MAVYSIRSTCLLLLVSFPLCVFSLATHFVGLINSVMDLEVVETRLAVLRIVHTLACDGQRQHTVGEGTWLGIRKLMFQTKLT